MVTDANIWIDLLNAGFEGRVFELGEPLVSPDLVLNELQGDLDDLVRLGLESRTLDGDQVERLVDLVARYQRCSAPDLAALLVASEENLTLLTGDGALRDVAVDLGVTVHGILWVLDQLVATGLITLREACVGLRRIQEANAFLPAREVQSRLRRWCQT